MRSPTTSPQTRMKRNRNATEKQQETAQREAVLKGLSELNKHVSIEWLSLLPDENLVLIVKKGIDKELKNHAITALKKRMKDYDKMASEYWMMKSTNKQESSQNMRSFFRYATPLLKLVRDLQQGGIPRGLQQQCEKFGNHYGLIESL